MSTLFPSGSDTFPAQATLDATNLDGSPYTGPPVTSFHALLHGNLGDGLHAVEFWLLNTMTTANVSEGANLYYTNARADARIALFTGSTNVVTAGTLTAGIWHGTKIGLAYGGTNADLSATGGTSQYLKQVSAGANVTVGTIPASDIASGAALTKMDDTNVTLTLGGSAPSALLAAASITVGWSGALAAGRGGTGSAFVAFAGPATSVKTFTLPNVDATLVYAGGPLGTPSSGTLTNCTGLPIGGVTGLGTGVATFLATPSSANLAAAVTDETGSGALVFATTPTLVTPILGTPTSGTLTNCAGLPAGGISLTTASLVGRSSVGVGQEIAVGSGLTLSGTTLTATGTGGTVTSVDASGGTTGLTFSGGPITAAGAVTLSGTLVVANGGTGLATLTAHALYVGNGTAAPTALPVGATNTVLHGNTGADPSFSAVVLTADVSGILPTANGGTGIAFFTAAGPTAARIYTFPDAACTILTTNAAVTVAQGGSGRASTTAYAVICGGTTSTAAEQSIASVGTSGQVLTSNGAGALPTFQAAAGGSLTVGTTAIASGTSTRLLYDNAGVLGEISNATSDGTTLTVTSGKFVTALNDTNGNELFKVTATGSAVNEFTVANAATGGNPTLSATGGDTNIGITLSTKGTGVLALRNSTTAQEFRVYRTYDGTNDAYLALHDIGSNVMAIEGIKTGSAALDRLDITLGGVSRILFFASETWISEGSFYPVKFASGTATCAQKWVWTPQTDSYLPAAFRQNSATQSANLTEWQNSAGTALSCITPDGWPQNTPGVKRLTADATNATVTMSNLSDLTVTLPAARKLVGRLTLYASDSTAIDGLAIDFDGGSATMTDFKAAVVGTPVGATLGTAYSTALATDLTATTATTGDIAYYVEISLEVNAAGTLIPRFAQVSHSTGTVTVRKGSKLELWDSPS